MIERECKNCGKAFETYPSVKRFYCNKVCGKKHREAIKFEKYKCKCKVCGVDFLPSRPSEGGTYCSRSCRGKDSRHDKVDRNGYWYICVPEHPLASSQGYVAEHHLVMESFLGHYIEDGMVVHHKDFNKKNNDISNLQYMTISEHNSLHAKLNRGIKHGRYFNKTL